MHSIKKHWPLDQLLFQPLSLFLCLNLFSYNEKWEYNFDNGYGECQSVRMLGTATRTISSTHKMPRRETTWSMIHRFIRTSCWEKNENKRDRDWRSSLPKKCKYIEGCALMPISSERVIQHICGARFEQKSFILHWRLSTFNNQDWFSTNQTYVQVCQKSFDE